MTNIQQSVRLYVLWGQVGDLPFVLDDFMQYRYEEMQVRYKLHCAAICDHRA